MGRKSELPLMVPRFGMRGFIPIKHLAIGIVILYFVYVFTIAYLWVGFLPNMEKAASETSELMEREGVEPVSIVQGEVIPELRVLYIISLIFFGIVDISLAILLWKAKPPLNNEKILSPLYSIYNVNRAIAIFLITQLSILALVGSNSRQLVNSLYIAIPIFSAVGIILLFLIYYKVLRKKMEEDVMFKLPDEAVL